MSFSAKSADHFGTVLDRTPYAVEDAVVKLQYVSRGQNVVFGRSLRPGDYRNLIYIGKILESAKGRSYLGADAWLDTTFPHVIYITGTRGSGKSFDLGVIVEGISRLTTPSPLQNGVTPITSIIIDTQSQFWTLGYPPRASLPENREQLQELERWNIAPNSLAESKVYVPPGAPRFLGSETTLQIRPRDVTAEEWCAFLDQEVYSPQGHIIAKTLEALGDTDYEITDILQYIADDSYWPTVAESSRNAISYKLDDYRRTGLFSAAGLRVRGSSGSGNMQHPSSTRASQRRQVADNRGDRPKPLCHSWETPQRKEDGELLRHSFRFGRDAGSRVARHRRGARRRSERPAVSRPKCLGGIRQAWSGRRPVARPCNAAALGARRSDPEPSEPDTQSPPELPERHQRSDQSDSHQVHPSHEVRGHKPEQLRRYGPHPRSGTVLSGRPSQQPCRPRSNSPQG